MDKRLSEVEARLAIFPRRFADVEARVTASRAVADKAKESHSTALKDRKRYELDAEQWKEKARKYRDQSFQVKTNEAFKALQHEIEQAEAEMAKAEDRLLEQMVSSEQYDRKVKEAEKIFKEVEEAARVEREKIQAEQVAAGKGQAELKNVRDRLVSGIPDDLLDHYERIARKHGGVAIAEVRDEACTACGARIRPHAFQELRREDNAELFHCEICTRILYYIEPAPASGASPQASVARSGES